MNRRYARKLADAMLAIREALDVLTRGRKGSHKAKGQALRRALPLMGKAAAAFVAIDKMTYRKDRPQELEAAITCPGCCGYGNEHACTATWRYMLLSLADNLATYGTPRSELGEALTKYIMPHVVASLTEYIMPHVVASMLRQTISVTHIAAFGLDKVAQDQCDWVVGTIRDMIPRGRPLSPQRWREVFTKAAHAFGVKVESSPFSPWERYLFTRARIKVDAWYGIACSEVAGEHPTVNDNAWQLVVENLRTAQRLLSWLPLGDEVMRARRLLHASKAFTLRDGILVPAEVVPALRMAIRWDGMTIRVRKKHLTGPGGSKVEYAGVRVHKTDLTIGDD